MEALAAFSLAGTIVQVVDFSSKVLTTTHELYKSTEKITIFQPYELVAADLCKITQHLNERKLPQISGGQSAATLNNNHSLQALLNECSEVASKLLARFEKLRVQGKKTK
ncbi:hypothetical protein ASPCAL12149 [Aspergillus calidoustus]|uniref:Uncharacterized protein n=1 Tax=Aspergillus calidoustus TaxID=454130 RepID=A0A0U5GD74_ASPCI|nr:hypothetical protein ASPCAL12149 [Aspergillus calidoustus]